MGSVVLIQKHFKTKGFVQGNIVVNAKGHDVDLSALPPFLRTLLVTDGTVTKSIEAYYWEPVLVESQLQQLVDKPARQTCLKNSPGSQYLHRKVTLSGQQSRRTYASADSYIHLNVLPETTAQRLVENKIGIGELLRDEGVESYREILDLGVETADETFWDTEKEVAYRTYVIHIEDKPAIEITEWFPVDLYRDAESS